MSVRDEILNEYQKIIKKYVDLACQEIRLAWYGYSDDLGEAHIRNDGFFLAKSELICTIVATGQKMWVLEYGKGSLMDREEDNFWLAYYKYTPEYNPARRSALNAILGRPKGTYYDLDGVLHFSNGVLEGKDLERINFLKDKGVAVPMRAKHIIQNILYNIGSKRGGIISLMQEELQQVTLKIIGNTFKQFPKKVIIHD